MTATEFDFVREKLDTSKGRAILYNIQRMKKFGYEVDSLPYSIKVLLENALRFSGQVPGAGYAARALADWPKTIATEKPFMPYRVLLQDYTGVPLVVDLAAMRDAANQKGMNPTSVNSSVPVDLVIDHSIQVDGWS
jgi:aconitate hydratase